MECASANQRLDRAAIDDTPIDARTEIEQIDERCVGPRGDDHLNRILAGALDRPQAIADFTLTDRFEAIAGQIDIRRQHANAILLCIQHEQLHLVGVIHVR